ncbi:MAG: hypothetical protein Q8P63_01485 [Candidatus Nealsonbacteria bacterium]|nr:hypothetical protein [Candidatus Nealsonbacteria bacterium]
MKNSKTKSAIKVLAGSKKVILNRLRQVVKTGSFNYRTFGTAIEEYISDVLIEVFKEANFIESDKDYILAPHKNHFPDFQLKTSPPLAIEYKSGNGIKLERGKWVPCKNSNNDMGTLNTWLSKIKKFGSKNIYYVFVIYKFDNVKKEITDIQIAPFYKFIGLNKVGLLSYREKDGNLRPKDLFGKSPVVSFEQFNKLFKKTIVYRSKRIIKKHRLILKSLRPQK